MSRIVPSTETALVWPALFCIATVCYVLLRVSGKDPLAKIPGPLLNRYTIWPLRVATIRGHQIHYVEALHQQYGSCVRISPEEASISDVDAVKEIHRIGSGYLKAAWYSKFTQEKFASQEDLGIFAMQDPKVHSVRRRLFSAAFSKSSLAGCEAIVHSKMVAAIAGLQAELKKDNRTDLLAWLTFMANDVISTLALGHRLEIWREKTQYIKDLETVMIISGISAELSWLAPILKRISPRPRLDAAGRQMLQQARQTSKSNTIFDKMVQQGEEETLTSEQIVREASNLLVAGSDTTARTLTYLIWAVLSSPDRTILSRLLAEVNSLHEGFTAEDANALPLLKHVIQETLRLYGAAPGALPRFVPKGGRELCSFYLPEGSIVSSQAYTLHRNAAIFPDPYIFKPDRWAQQTSAMKDAFMPFGGGTRICIGLHLAHMELLLGAAYFFRTFGSLVGIAPETTAESMELENHFLVGPKGHACMLAYSTSEKTAL